MHDGTDGEQHDRTAMATIDRTSPSMFQGLSWDEWANTVAQEGDKGKLEVFRYRSGPVNGQFVYAFTRNLYLKYVFDGMFPAMFH